MPKTKVNEIEMYYEIHGEGEPLFLIMGLGGETTRWFSILPLLAEHFRVITFDNRGAGKSGKPDIPYTMEMMSGDIAGLMDILEIEKSHVFGISLGGMIAQSFALLYPDRIASLILGCTRCGGTHSVVDRSPGVSVLDPSLIESMLPEERAVEMMPALWSREFIDSHPEIVDMHIDYAKNNPIDPVGYRRQLESVNTHDTWTRLPEIKAPTLVIAGDADLLIPVENSRVLASRIPDSELVILPGMGHGFYTEAHEETARAITDFARRHPLAG